MFLPDELSAGLPARRDDEPASLRRDIIDELGDHLACAMRREMLTGRGEEGDARRRVLLRFGDPAALVRRLWRDALWEQIMSQRLLIGMCLAVLLMCGAAFGMTWSLLQSWQASNAAQLEQQRELFEKLMESSQRAAEENLRRTDALIAKSQPLAEWNPVEIRCVIGQEDGPPAEGVEINLDPIASETGALPNHGVTDGAGNVQFPKVRFGSYGFRCRTKAGEETMAQIELLPGETLRKTVVCPVPHQPIEVAPRIQWPDDLKAEPLVLAFDETTFVRTANQTRWTINGKGWNGNQSGHRTRLLVRADHEPFSEEVFTLAQSGTLGMLRDSLRRPFDVQHVGSTWEPREVISSEAIMWWPAEDAVPSALGLRIEKSLPNIPEMRDRRYRNSQSVSSFTKTIAGDQFEYRFEPGVLTLVPKPMVLNNVRSILAMIKETAEKIQLESEADPASARSPSSQQ